MLVEISILPVSSTQQKQQRALWKKRDSMIDDLVWCNVVWNSSERNKGEQTFTSFSGISFLYTCKAAELLLVVEIKLEGKSIFMSTQMASDTWGQCSFLTVKCKSRTFPRLQLIKTEPDEQICQFFCFKALFASRNMEIWQKHFDWRHHNESLGW